MSHSQHEAGPIAGVNDEEPQATPRERGTRHTLTAPTLGLALASAGWAARGPRAEARAGGDNPSRHDRTPRPTNDG
jgi:hypothetical protein